MPYLRMHSGGKSLRFLVTTTSARPWISSRENMAVTGIRQRNHPHQGIVPGYTGMREVLPHLMMGSLQHFPRKIIAAFKETARPFLLDFFAPQRPIQLLSGQPEQEVT